MHEILKKRILNLPYRVISLGNGINDAYNEGFKKGAEYMLAHQWISVEEALPGFEEEVIAANADGELFFCHRSNRPGVKTADFGWCNYTGTPVTHWMPVPEL